MIGRAATVAGLSAVLAACMTTTPPPPGAIAGEAARYACTDGTAFTALFDPAGDGATLTFQRVDRDDPDALEQDRGFRIVLEAQRVGSGFWYAGSGWSLRGKGSEAMLTRPDSRVSACRAGDVPPPTGAADI